MKETDQIVSFYEEYDEWSRLDRHKVEFEITKKYLDVHIPKNSRILDIGGGPGKYSIYLASMGHKVTLLDLTEKHIFIAKEKSKEFNVSIERYIHGDALKLENYNLGKFDAILLMGPLYHLTNKGDREKVLRDSLEHLNPGGLLFVAFISAYAPLIDSLKNNLEGLKDPDKFLKYLNDGRNRPEEGFTTAYFTKPDEALSFIESFGLEKIAFAGVEGLTSIIEQKINELPLSEFEQCVRIIYELSQDTSTFGSSEHYLYVGRKPEGHWSS